MQRFTFDEALKIDDVAGSVTIYGLASPFGTIRYVGRTNALRSRLWRHLRGVDDSPKKNEWIRSLLDAGKRPDVVVLEVVPESEWQEAERRWIRLLGGDSLLNATNGGDEWCVHIGTRLTEEHKRKIGDANRGRKHPPEFGRMISERLRGRKLTDEHRRKVSEGLRGHSVSAETRARLTAARAKRPAFVVETQTPEARKKRSESTKRRWAELKAQGKSWRSKDNIHRPTLTDR
jgi:hypothetical protein